MTNSSIPAASHYTQALAAILAALTDCNVRIRQLAFTDDFLTLEYTYGSERLAHTTEEGDVVIDGQPTRRMRGLIEAHAALYYCG